MPIATLLHTGEAHECPEGDSTLMIFHQYTPKDQLKKHIILADIVVSAGDSPNPITADIQKGAAAIHMGIEFEIP